MKTLALIVFLFFTVAVNGQTTQSGVFITAADFLSSKLSDPVDCKDSHHAIKKNSFLNKPYITITFEGKKIRYNKSKVYGYQDCDKNIFRFSDNKEYQVINTQGFFLYKHEELEGGVKSANTTTKYYFSSLVDTGLLPLTLLNLKRAFPSLHKFHDDLDSSFKGDDELMKYDSFHKNYVVIHIFNESGVK